MKKIEALLEYQRKKLLDTSRHSPLLNYRLTSKTIEMTSDWPQDVFRYLVSWEKSMTFLERIDDNEKRVQILKRYIETNSEEEELETDFDVDDSEFYANEFRVGASYSNFMPGDSQEPRVSALLSLRNDAGEACKRLISLGKLPTDYPTDDLNKRLRTIHRDIQTFNREWGVNPYYLTLGMLEWDDQSRGSGTNISPLVLIPVEILQKNRPGKKQFEVRYTDEDIEFNDTLYEKLLEDFKLQLPSKISINPNELEDYFQSIEDMVKGFNWKVDRTKITLTALASGKFRMQKDLKIDSWVVGSSVEISPTLDKLVNGGFQRSWQSSFQHTHLVDSLVPPAGTYPIYDVDSSQLLAIHYISQGHDLRIQGPPGTGKSQTITNIIAQAIGDRKTVLFVAQKETALNVVKKNLANAGLEELCLELHGHKTKRRTFVREMQQSLDYSNNILLQQDWGNIPELISARDRLNNYSNALNTPLEEEGLTLFQCFEELLRLQNIVKDINPPMWLDSKPFSQTNSPQYYEWSPKVENLQRLLAEIGMPQDNVFRFCQYSDDIFIAPEHSRQIIKQSQNILNDLRESLITLANHLKVSPPLHIRQSQLLIHLSDHILQSPSLIGVNIRPDKWKINSRAISNTILALRQSSELKRKYNNILRSNAWNKSVEPLLKQIRTNSTLLQRIFNLATGVPDEMIELCLNEPPKNVKDQLDLLNAIVSYQTYQQTIKYQEPLFNELLEEETWREMCSDWKDLSNLDNWLSKLYQTIQVTNQSSVLDYLENGIQFERLQEFHDLALKNLKQYEISVSFLVKHLLLDEEGQFGKGHKFLTQSFAHQDELLNTWFDNINQLKDIIDYNRLKKELVANGLTSVVELGEIWPEAGRYLADTVKYIWYLHLINENAKNEPELASFNRVIHEKNIQNFCKLDEDFFKANKAYIIGEHYRKVMESFKSNDLQAQLTDLKMQSMNTRSKKSIRKLMEESGEAIQILKPVFMMSPASVAKFLPPTKVEFDLVIFDEASQIRPEDATGAILRGRQTVVVGDRYQLPPTDFFTPSEPSTNLDDTIDAESILDLFYIAGVPETTLLWHYRSQHHSLIMPSNQIFYKNELVAFPSPQTRNKELGVHLSPVAGSVYDRGGTRTNIVGARRVAQAVLQHATNHSDLSLGVVALHKNQASAIEHEINILRSQYPQHDDFFEEENKFLVTYLENVQGDEKDVIFISIGYGFSKDGRLTLNFGPISQEGGDRRLNVLTTRAKRQCIVFSSIKGRHILERNPSSHGARYLAKYLEYAETGFIQNYESIQNSFYITEDDQQKHDRLVQLHAIFDRHFNLNELQELCFQLVGIDFENLSGDTKSSKARDLALHFHRRENVNHLIQVGQELRPDIDWSEIDNRVQDELSDADNQEVSIHMLPTLEDSFQKYQEDSFYISQLEKEVVETLEAHGYCVKRHIGPPNAAIPIAVIDEDQQTALLGIEFDGPNYHQARSARDRDRLRRQKLEKLQWNIYRIWIIDWYYNKEREIERLISTITQIQQQRESQK